MNKWFFDILNVIMTYKETKQRQIATLCGYSLGMVNKGIRALTEDGYLDESGCVTEKGSNYILEHSPKSAVILAAGYGMRMVPINTEVSKGLVEVEGVPLVERHIQHLQEVGVQDIYIVVGFLKEQYEYLIDMYGVKLIVNRDYREKNNLFSVYRAIKHIRNTYIIPCDIWCKENPFRKYEARSWYMVSERMKKSQVRLNRKNELVQLEKKGIGNQMVGIAYISVDEADDFAECCVEYALQETYDSCFWEEVLYENGKMMIPARVVAEDFAVEINTYEDLRELDGSSNHLRNDAIEVIMDVMNVDVADITEITVLKKGMTNRSFLFNCKGKRYIMRIPGEGTSELINRKQEAAVYNLVAGQGICDEVVYMNPENGYKITEYIPNVRVCDETSVEDLTKCMKKLRDFHACKYKVGHDFDLFGQMEYYESLWKEPSVYRDYETTKANVLSLKSYIDSQEIEKILCHIDANHDNFLFSKAEDGSEQLYLIDWEYAGMQDAHVDIAMFCIYAMYEREQVERLIDIYFENHCPPAIRKKIYAYIAICGLLWSNWCEYKRQLGVEFGEYSLKQYRYAKEYYRLFENCKEENM